MAFQLSTNHVWIFFLGNQLNKMKAIDKPWVMPVKEFQSSLEENPTSKKTFITIVSVVLLHAG